MAVVNAPYLRSYLESTARALIQISPIDSPVPRFPLMEPTPHARYADRVKQAASIWSSSAGQW